MNRTAEAKKARIILTIRFGTSRFRIGTDGTIRVRGVMPGTNQEGWYVWGALTDAQTRHSLRLDA